MYLVLLSFFRLLRDKVLLYYRIVYWMPWNRLVSSFIVLFCPSFMALTLRAKVMEVYLVFTEFLLFLHEPATARERVSGLTGQRRIERN